MPQGQIRKGFFFYFGLFVLLLISIFLICLVIMMFNPGKTVLWMQYFTANDDELIEKTSDGSRTIDWSQVNSLEINCSYANVVVQKNNEYNLDCVHIVNNAKGFAVESNAVHFDYNVYYEGSTLKIDVTEPTGFMFFSKDIRIILHASENSSLNFSTLNLKITTTSGNVEIGGTTAKAAEEIRLNSLDVSTGSGRITFSQMFNTSSLTGLNLYTEEGKLLSTKNINYGNETVNGFVVNCDATIGTDKGAISYDYINTGSHDIYASCKSGTFAADYIVAENLKVTCVQGNYKFGNVMANLDYTNSEDSLLAPNIVVDYLSGNFTISGGDNFKGSAEPSVNIKKIDGEISMLVDKGSITVGEANGAVDINSEDNLNVDIIIGENNGSAKRIITQNSNVSIGFLGVVSNNTTIETDRGNIVVNVTSVANFTANAWVNDLEGTTRLADDKISISHGLIEGETKNPLVVRGTSSTSGTLTIRTNSSLSYNLVAKENLV